jgi:hypothetical protein
VKARIDKSLPDPDEIDAKHVVNQLLAEDGVASQFIATKEPGKSGSGPITTDEELAATAKDDYAGHGAVADMLRTAGLVHARLGEALSFGKRYGITEPPAFVGLHLREQKRTVGACPSRWQRLSSVTGSGAPGDTRRTRTRRRGAPGGCGTRMPTSPIAPTT